MCRWTSWSDHTFYMMYVKDSICKRQWHRVEMFSIHYVYTCIYFSFSWSLTKFESRIWLWWITEQGTLSHPKLPKVWWSHGSKILDQTLMWWCITPKLKGGQGWIGFSIRTENNTYLHFPFSPQNNINVTLVWKCQPYSLFRSHLFKFKYTDSLGSETVNIKEIYHLSLLMKVT